jgi:hypothetical protein
MATKIKLMKLLQEMRGLAEMNRRHPAPRPTALYLLQLRSHMVETSHSRRRLLVRMDLKESLDLPHPVKINHVTSRLSDEPAS